MWGVWEEATHSTRTREQGGLEEAVEQTAEDSGLFLQVPPSTAGVRQDRGTERRG